MSSPPPVVVQQHQQQKVLAAPEAAAPGEQQVIAREELVEYRDEQGNVLDEAQVAALDGKVSFQTRYETRTRLVDPDGHELGDKPAEAPPRPDGRIAEGMAPPHPDVEGQNPETAEAATASGAAPAADTPASGGSKQADAKAARPGSEANEATK